MSLDDFQPISERSHDFVSDETDGRYALNKLEWIKTMSDASRQSVLGKFSFSKDSKFEMKNELIDPALTQLSQKVMKNIWDNKEDEFWNTY